MTVVEHQAELLRRADELEEAAKNEECPWLAIIDSFGRVVRLNRYQFPTLATLLRKEAAGMEG